MKRETLPIMDVTFDHEWHMARDPKHPDAKDRPGGTVVLPGPFRLKMKTERTGKFNRLVFR
jgi:hypothetical protein